MNVEHKLSIQEIAHFEMKHDSNNLDILETIQSTDSNVDSSLEGNILDTWTIPSDEKVGGVDERMLTSILRRQQQYHDNEYESLIYPITTRRVSFPSDSSLATYREPEYLGHWDICTVEYCPINCFLLQIFF